MDWLSEFIQATAWEMTPPEAYGPFHLTFTFVGIALCAFAAWKLRKLGDKGNRILLMPLLFFLCGYLTGLAGRRRLAHNLPSFMVFSIFGGGLRCLFTVGIAALDLKTMPPVTWFWRGMVPGWVLTFLASAIVYGIVWGERKILEPK